MKYTILIIVFAFVLKPVLPVCSYIINYDYIVKELCENKAKPQLHCNGKCYLMKELAKNAEGEKPLQKKGQQQEREVLFYKDLQNTDLTCAVSVVYRNSVFAYSNLYKGTAPHSAFHPPALI